MHLLLCLCVSAAPPTHLLSDLEADTSATYRCHMVDWFVLLSPGNEADIVNVTSGCIRTAS